jgi:hypothetical protein
MPPLAPAETDARAVYAEQRRRQLRHVARDAARLILGEHLG